MRFALDQEQQDMADALRNLLNAADTPRIARDWAVGDAEAWWKLWRGLAELGLTGLTVAQRHGGLGLGPVELAVCLEECGYAALPGPLVESLAFLPRLLSDAWLEDLAAGRSIGTAVIADHLPYALDADQADAVFHCDSTVRRLGGIRLRRQESFDPTRRLFRVDHSASALVSGDFDAAFDEGVLGCASYLLGLGRRLLDTSTEYVKQRHQFGRPVGEFQAVKHHLANVALKLEFARPLIRGACLSMADDVPWRFRDVSAAKIAAGDAAYAAARTALQVHGAIGYTAEHDLHLWLTKATALRSAWGTPAWHRRRVAAALATDTTTPIGAASGAGGADFARNRRHSAAG
ncbi:acyl-CoA/acyl-ACP dehydrogenase [Saccharopolyspora sp. K220]|uniref:acyl-CoA dehydrogenase family protein n=1 Tax=Saccharopolyspora soli TaxID=2926618 RepID=UPI001F584C53|nr:acyl-CoA dehydrogenase family protein [Saccharopolyspora soli]MCI2418116.1 acyl-CoA/acyl-ACP dehydrogenase [Saccharopolyspora soli]